MLPRVMAVSVLLALGAACGKQRGFDSIREEAAERGNRHYQNQMGLILQTGKEGETNYVEALRWYVAASTPTNHVVQKGELLVDILKRYRILNKNLTNNVVNVANKINFRKPLKAGTKIVIPGYGPAMYNAGAIYEVRYKELGLKQKAALTNAAHWYAKGSDAGFVRAQFAYGYALEHGQGVTMNLEQAANNYELSANQGMAAAQERLGNLHLTGFGSQGRSLPDAYRWLSIAQQSLKGEGGQPAPDLLKAIATCRRSLTADELARQNQLIRAFKAVEN